MNELIFVFHILVVIGFIFLALRLGENALIALIALQGILANLFVVKQISLFGFSVTASDVFAIGSILSLNLVQEYFGKESARKSIKISFLSLLFFAACSQIHLIYEPNAFDVTAGSFQTIFSHSPRIIFASIASFYLVQQFDVRFFALLKGKLAVRIASSLFFSQLLDTILFSILGLWGIIGSLLDVILISFLVKCIIIFTSSFFVVFTKKLVRSEV